MADYSKFKKSFCECCDTNKKGLCRLGWVCQPDKNRIFIDWEDVADTKPAPEHDWARCDCLYVLNDDIAYLIEFKNVRWFYDNRTRKFKSLSSIQKALIDKFTSSKRLIEMDGTPIKNFHYMCAYDFNNIDSLNKSIGELKRLLRNNFFIYLEKVGIYSEECKSLYYEIPF